jgi:RND family efflux transporter MFP subunit
MVKVMKMLPVMLAVATFVGCKKEVVEKKEVARPAKIFTVKESNGYGVRIYPGKAYAPSSVNLSFKVSGQIIKDHFTDGQFVKKGQLLLELDPRDYKTALDMINASVAQLKAELFTAESDLNRQKELKKNNATTQAAYDEAEGKFLSIKAELQNVLAKQEQAENALKDTKMYAPFAGVIAKSSYDLFKEVEAKEPLVLLQVISTIDIKVDVPEDVAVYARGEVKAASKIFVEFSSIKNMRYPVKVKSVETTADEVTNTFRVTLTMKAPEGFELKPGMTCKVIHESAIYGGAKGMIVPLECVASLGENNSFVWVVKEDNRLTKREVTVKEIHKNGIEIKSGLKPGEKILASGVNYAYENMLIKELTAQ